jgi:DNA-binding SARP family transcriptional activator
MAPATATTATATTVVVRMFGPLQLQAGGTRLGARDLGGVKPKQLLAVLLLERGRLVPKERIGELLWGERPPRRVAATIETYVSVLRHRLDRLPGRGRGLLVTEPGGYRLGTDGLDVDLDRYEALLRDAAASGPAARRAALEEAVALAGGELLADEPYAAWAVPAREHYRERQVQALVDLAECCLDLGDGRAALAAAGRALALAPTRERAYRAGMVAHDLLGERDAALWLYERCRATLAEELGVPPDAQTAGLHTAILRGQPAGAPLPPRRPAVGPPGVPAAAAAAGRLCPQRVGPDRLPGRR